jgi:flagellar export protein FliJ
MKKRTTLATLISLAGEDKDRAAESLAAAVADQRRAEATLDTLTNYLSDYRQASANKAVAGATALELKNQQAFLGQLDQIIDKQKTLLSAARHKVENCRDEWRGHFRREKSYDLLERRRQAADAAHQLKQEQKLQDEHASRQHHDKHRPTDQT